MKAFSRGVRDIDRCAPFLIPVARCSRGKGFGNGSCSEACGERSVKLIECCNEISIRRFLDVFFSSLQEICILRSTIFIIDTTYADNI